MEPVDPAGRIEPLLAELVDASLVIADPPRYRLLETVRHVALGHLGPDGERRARDAHARWMLDLAAALLRGARERDPWTYPAMRRELANLQEAPTWLSEGGGDRDDGARLAALLAVVVADSPDPGFTEQLARWAPERVETGGEVLRAFAAGTAEWLRGHLAEADRLLTAVLDRMPADHELRWGALLIRISNAMFAGRPAEVRADAARVAADPQAPAWARATGVCCAALKAAYDALAPGGMVVAVEPWSADDWTTTIGMPITRIGYASSTALCTPGSLAQPGAYGLGTLGGPATRLQLLAEAGFTNPVLGADTGFNLLVAASKA